MDVKSIVDALERGPSIVVPLVRQAPADTIRRRPAARKWSMHEHACHLSEVDALMTRRLDVLLSDEQPFIHSWDPGRDDPDERLLQFDLDQSLNRYVADRVALVARLRALADRDWERTARHDEYNSYSVFTMFRHLALHDFFHAYRIEELLLRADWPPPHSTFGHLVI